MTLGGTRRYVGFGFGAIQAGLFLYEAHRSGSFRQLTIAEVVPQVVNSIRQADGLFALNIAHTNRIEQVQVGPIQIENPQQQTDRQRLVEAIAGADEIGTAVPSVDYYVSDSEASLHSILAEGLRLKASMDGTPAVIYTAENNNHAAEILEAQVMAAIPEAERAAVREKVRFLNTVIGKMSGVVTDATEIQAQHLVPLTSDSSRAFLVEAFNHILISQVNFQGESFECGITVFEEKADLLPFEEDKLYGHNAVHALAAYVGAIRNLRWIADLRAVPGAVAFLEAALIEESGAALIHKYAGLDNMFTLTTYQENARALLDRVMNPYLRDTVERIGRDPKRKLGWDDRLIGAMRLMINEGVIPHRYAFGAAAALVAIEPSLLHSTIKAEEILLPIWGDTQIDEAAQRQVLGLVELGLKSLRRWVTEGYPSSEAFSSSIKS